MRLSSRALISLLIAELGLIVGICATGREARWLVTHIHPSDNAVLYISLFSPLLIALLLGVATLLVLKNLHLGTSHNLPYARASVRVFYSILGAIVGFIPSFYLIFVGLIILFVRIAPHDGMDGLAALVCALFGAAVVAIFCGVATFFTLKRWSARAHTEVQQNGSV